PLVSDASEYLAARARRAHDVRMAGKRRSVDLGGGVYLHGFHEVPIPQTSAFFLTDTSIPIVRRATARQRAQPMKDPERMSDDHHRPRTKSALASRPRPSGCIDLRRKPHADNRRPRTRLGVADPTRAVEPLLRQRQAHPPPLRAMAGAGTRKPLLL